MSELEGDSSDRKAATPERMDDVKDDQMHPCPECGEEIPINLPVSQCPHCPPRPELGNSEALTIPMDSENLPNPKAVEVDDQPTVPQTTGASNSTPSIEMMEESFPELEILELLGAGGMGTVYKVRQPRLDRLAALKILSCPPDLLDNFTLRFEREAQLLAKPNHPHIVTIYDFGESNLAESNDGPRSMFYFLMEYVDGTDLNQLIRTGDLKPDQAL